MVCFGVGLFLGGGFVVVLVWFGLVFFDCLFVVWFCLFVCFVLFLPGVDSTGWRGFKHQ